MYPSKNRPFKSHQTLSPRQRCTLAAFGTQNNRQWTRAPPQRYKGRPSHTHTSIQPKDARLPEGKGFLLVENGEFEPTWAWATQAQRGSQNHPRAPGSCLVQRQLVDRACVAFSRPRAGRAPTHRGKGSQPIEAAFPPPDPTYTNATSDKGPCPRSPPPRSRRGKQPQRPRPRKPRRRRTRRRYP